MIIVIAVRVMLADFKDEHYRKSNQDKKTHTRENTADIEFVFNGIVCNCTFSFSPFVIHINFHSDQIF